MFQKHRQYDEKSHCLGIPHTIYKITPEWDITIIVFTVVFENVLA